MYVYMFFATQHSHEQCLLRSVPQRKTAKNKLNDKRSSLSKNLMSHRILPEGMAEDSKHFSNFNGL